MPKTRSRQSLTLRERDTKNFCMIQNLNDYIQQVRNKIKHSYMKVINNGMG